MNNALDNMDMDSLLDTTLDDLEDLPEFKVFQPGGHKLSVTFSQKEINSNPVIDISCTLIETVELEDKQAEADPPGTISSTPCFLNNEFGRAQLKRLSKPFAEKFGYSSIREVVEGVQDVEVLAITAQRTDRLDSSKKYLNIVELTVL